MEQEAIRKALGNQRLDELKAQILASEAQLSALRQTYTAEHPEIQALQEQLEALRKQRGENFAESYTAQAQELENQLRILRDHNTLEQSAAAMALEQTAQAEALAKRLAEFQSSAQSLRGLEVVDCRLKSITVEGLSQRQRDRLLSALPVHVGDTLSGESIEKIETAVKQFDQDLRFVIHIDGHTAEIHITAPERHL
jgi:hypothetical protein